MCSSCLVPQSCPALCNPMDCSLPGPSVHGDSPGKNTGVGCHAILQGIFPTWGSIPGVYHTATEAETPVLWPPDAKSQFIRKDSDSRKDWREKEKGMTENEMIEWHHWLNGHEFGLALGNGDGQWSRACCSPWVANSWTQQTHDPHLHWYTDHPDRKPIYTALKLLIKSDGLNYYR